MRRSTHTHTHTQIIKQIMTKFFGRKKSWRVSVFLFQYITPNLNQNRQSSDNKNIRLLTDAMFLILLLIIMFHITVSCKIRNDYAILNHKLTWIFNFECFTNLIFVDPCIIVQFIKKSNNMQKVSKFYYSILNEVQHVSGDTPPIIRSLKLHRQPLVIRT
jgi:hypothetical protein